MSNLDDIFDGLERYYDIGGTPQISPWVAKQQIKDLMLEIIGRMVGREPIDYEDMIRAVDLRQKVNEL